jgi:ABC-type protease/lipase transport system fused ATPase/permease subunit
MILQLAKGYDTEIGFDGSTLSGGQRQRIGLARAFFGDPKLLVLDEPNANLDAFGELALSNAISRAKEKKITTIIISHRTSILTLVDKILVMKDGELAMFGERSEVMNKMNQSARPVVVDLNNKKLN